MTKVDIVDKIYKKVGFPKSEVAKIMETIFDMIKETLQHEDKIMVSGFGNFVIRNKKARRVGHWKTQPLSLKIVF